MGVVPSDLSSSTLQPVVTGTTVTPVGVIANFTLSGSTVTAYSPWAAVYSATDSGGLTQLWGLPLVDTNDANPPTPVQIGSLSQPPASVCGSFHGGYANVLFPASAFFITSYAPSGGSCSSPTTVLINWTDSSSTPPTPIPAGQNFTDLYLYPSGYLYAEVALTGFDGNLNIYPASKTGTPSFSSPTTVTSGVTNVEHHAITVSRNGVANNTVLFENVLAMGKYYLYRIDTSGNNGALVYTAAGTLEVTPLFGVNIGTVYDDTNIYFVDMVGSSTPITYNFYKAPIDCGGSTGVACTAVQIGTAVEPSGTFPFGTLLTLVDADGTSLILEDVTAPYFGLYTLSVTGGTTQSPTLLWQYNVAGANGILAFLDYGTDNLFVDELGSTPTSLVLTPSSTTPRLAPAPFTSFTQWAPFIAGGPTNDTVLQFQNLTADGTDGGAILNVMKADSFATTVVDLNSTPYLPPAQSNVLLAPVSNTIGFGTQYPPAGANMGLVIDVSKNQIITISVPDTNVAPF